MFTFEIAFHLYRRKHGIVKALADYADLQDAPMRHALKPTSSEPVILWPPEPTVFDFNEHFLELSNLRSGEAPRWIALVMRALFAPFCLIMGVGALWFLWNIVFVGDSRMPFPPTSFAELGLLLGVLALAIFSVPMTVMLWREFAGQIFTARCARYRFNRTTGKVYVLRPDRWGGNAMLDWSRAQAHVHWAPPIESAQNRHHAASVDETTQELHKQLNASRHFGWEVDGSLAYFGLLDLIMGLGVPRYDLSDEARRKRRSASSNGCLLLYWPPLNTADPQRRGEDLIWVGPSNSGERFWRYLQTFMQRGMDAVPAPEVPNAWICKGRDPDRVLNWLAECLCYWPVFPSEWKSDSGQARRESGIGPEQPLRWRAKLP
ncbi:hypothetical protein AB4142_20530 [Variovorax sp. 2RAF20]|uniref:hypothetical protein n=1 Tax=Variovorax sp. CF313 TaxID=1144315 RepID=UPI0002712884|nr:hypothetical protein [Variovorax sp. CF313]EJL67855.1 hypothetical protein PMI12_05473 [Variovorax sp. CF313]